MILGGAAFCIGAILCAFAQDLAMLIIGRVCLGAGVGFANQVCLSVCPIKSLLLLHKSPALGLCCMAEFMLLAANFLWHIKHSLLQSAVASVTCATGILAAFRAVTQPFH